MKGYKVVRTFKTGKIISAYSDGHIVEYKIGEWVKRPDGCGPLAVFNTLENAKDFVFKGTFGPTRKIFLCEYESSILNYLWCRYTLQDKKMRREKHLLPIGTQLAERVMLIREVGI